MTNERIIPLTKEEIIGLANRVEYWHNKTDSRGNPLPGSYTALLKEYLGTISRKRKLWLDLDMVVNIFRLRREGEIKVIREEEVGFHDERILLGKYKGLDALKFYELAESQERERGTKQRRLRISEFHDAIGEAREYLGEGERR